MKIAIVGNSPDLLKHEWGKEIDDHDIVIRFNSFVTKGFEQYTGSKTTDLAFCPYKFNDIIYSLSKEHRLLIYASESISAVKKLIKQTSNNKLSIDDCTIIDNNIYYKQLIKKLKAKKNWQGSAGLVMCQYISDNYPDAQIDVYGITFFKDTIKTTSRYNKIHTMTGDLIDSGHDPDAEWNYYEKYLKDKINLHL